MLRPLIGLDKTITSSSLPANVSDLPLELLVDRYDKILRAPYHEHIVGFHMTSLKFKLQNYRFYRDFTFTMY